MAKLLSQIGRESRGVDQADDVGLTGARVGDDGSPVGVPHQHRWSLQLLHHPQRRGHIVGKVGRERKLYGKHGMTCCEQQRDDPAVTGPVSPDPMHQYDIDAGVASRGTEMSDACCSFVGGRQGC